jgi:hypothetical protein
MGIQVEKAVDTESGVLMERCPIEKILRSGESA